MSRKKKKTSPDLVENQTRIAFEINAHFKISCSRMLVQKWQRKFTPPFPAPDAGGRYSRKACFAWVEKNVMAQMAKEGGGESEMQKLTALAELKKLKNDIEEAEEKEFDRNVKRGNYVLKTEAQRTANGVLKTYHGFVRRTLEVNSTDARREKLQQLGLAPETVAAFYEFDLAHARSLIDEIETRCAKEAANVS